MRHAQEQGGGQCGRGTARQRVAREVKAHEVPAAGKPLRAERGQLSDTMESDLVLSKDHPGGYVEGKAGGGCWFRA